MRTISRKRTLNEVKIFKTWLDAFCTGVNPEMWTQTKALQFLDGIGEECGVMRTAGAHALFLENSKHLYAEYAGASTASIEGLKRQLYRLKAQEADQRKTERMAERLTRFDAISKGTTAE